MYQPFFNLKEPPFAITPDPRFLFLGRQHEEALAHLLYSVRGSSGFILLTGEVGAGKTTISRCLIQQVPSSVDVALIFNPKLSALELVASICDDLGISYPENATLKILFDALNRRLLESYANNRTTVLILDEAQNLSIELLEQVRLLGNLETAKSKLLQIILIGQPELTDMLARPELRQFSQRITARYHIVPLSFSETRAFIRHRLSIAGSHEPIFGAGAIWMIHRASQGIPRLINQICDRALLGAYTLERRRVGFWVARSAIQEVMGVPRHPQRRSRTRRGVPLSLLFLLFGLWMVGPALFPGNASSWVDPWRDSLDALFQSSLERLSTTLSSFTQARRATTALTPPEQKSEQALDPIPTPVQAAPTTAEKAPVETPHPPSPASAETVPAQPVTAPPPVVAEKPVAQTLPAQPPSLMELLPSEAVANQSPVVSEKPTMPTPADNPSAMPKTVLSESVTDKPETTIKTSPTETVADKPESVPTEAANQPPAATETAPSTKVAQQPAATETTPSTEVAQQSATTTETTPPTAVAQQPATTTETTPPTAVAQQPATTTDVEKQPATAAEPVVPVQPVVNPSPVTDEKPERKSATAQPSTVTAGESAVSTPAPAPVIQPTTPTPVENNPVSEPQPSSTLLETLFTTPSAETTSRYAVMTRLFSLWGVELKQLSNRPTCEQAVQVGFKCQQMTGDWNTLRQWDRPALLTFTRFDKAPRYALITAIGHQHVTLRFARREETFLLREVERYWDGTITLLQPLNQKATRPNHSAPTLRPILDDGRE